MITVPSRTNIQHREALLRSLCDRGACIRARLCFAGGSAGGAAEGAAKQFRFQLAPS